MKICPTSLLLQQQISDNTDTVVATFCRLWHANNGMTVISMFCWEAQIIELHLKCTDGHMCYSKVDLTQSNLTSFNCTVHA